VIGVFFVSLSWVDICLSSETGFGGVEKNGSTTRFAPGFSISSDSLPRLKIPVGGDKFRDICKVLNQKQEEAI